MGSVAHSQQAPDTVSGATCCSALHSDRCIVDDNMATETWSKAELQEAAVQQYSDRPRQQPNV